MLQQLVNAPSPYLYDFRHFLYAAFPITVATIAVPLLLAPTARGVIQFIESRKLLAPTVALFFFLGSATTLTALFGNFATLVVGPVGGVVAIWFLAKAHRQRQDIGRWITFTSLLVIGVLMDFIDPQWTGYGRGFVIGQRLRYDHGFRARVGSTPFLVTPWIMVLWWKRNTELFAERDIAWLRSKHAWIDRLTRSTTWPLLFPNPSDLQPMTWKRWFGHYIAFIVVILANTLVSVFVPWPVYFGATTVPWGLYSLHQIGLWKIHSRKERGKWMGLLAIVMASFFLWWYTSTPAFGAPAFAPILYMWTWRNWKWLRAKNRQSRERRLQRAPQHGTP